MSCSARPPFYAPRTLLAAESKPSKISRTADSGSAAPSMLDWLHTIARSWCLRKKRSICMGQPQVRNERGGAVGQEAYALEVHGCEVAVHMQSVLSGGHVRTGSESSFHT